MAKTTNRKVELHVAYLWDCDACGRENFCREQFGLVHMTPEDYEGLPDDVEITDDMLGDLLFPGEPDTVTCAFCNAEFETEGCTGDH